MLHKAINSDDSLSKGKTEETEESRLLKQLKTIANGPVKEPIA
jgi:hypothetical protein